MFKPKVGSVHIISDLKVGNQTIHSYAALEAAIEAVTPLIVAVKLTGHKLCVGWGPIGRLKDGGLGCTLLFQYDDDITVDGVIFEELGKMKLRVTKV